MSSKTKGSKKFGNAPKERAANEPAGKRPKASARRKARQAEVKPEPELVRAALRAATDVPTSKDSAPDPQISLDTQTHDAVEFTQSNAAPETAATTGPEFPGASKEQTKMTLTLAGQSKNGKAAFYTGAAQRLRIPVGAFPDKTPPQTFEVADGVFAPARQPKAKMTAEERKAARANAPKLTLAERIAKREAQLQKDKERLAAEQAAGQPQL